VFCVFKRIASVLAGRKAQVKPPAPELDNVRTFRAHLLALGLSAEEAGEILIDRVVSASLFYEAKGYTFRQFACEMPPRVWLTIPTGEADKKLYWEGSRRSKCFRQFYPHDFTP
jgi:hypothetical protein